MQEERRRPRRRTSTRSPAELPEVSKSDVSEPEPTAAAQTKRLKRKVEVSEQASVKPAAPKVPGAVMLRQQNLRSPLLPRPATLPPRPKLRQVCWLMYQHFGCVSRSASAVCVLTCSQVSLPPQTVCCLLGKVRAQLQAS